MSEENWYEGSEMPEGYTPSEKMSEFKGVGDVMKAYDALRTDNSSKIRVPGEDATEEERGEFTSKLKDHLGIAPPATPEDYSWKAPEGMEDYFTDADAELKKYHEAGYDDKTVSYFMGEKADALSGVMNSLQENQAEMAKQSESALREKWGDNYDDNMKAAQSVQERYPEMVEVLKSAGLANHETIIKGMYDVAMSVREDRPPAGGAGNTDTLVDRLAALKESDAYKNGRHPKHKAVMLEIGEVNKSIIKLGK